MNECGNKNWDPMYASKMFELAFVIFFSSSIKIEHAKGQKTDTKNVHRQKWHESIVHCVTLESSKTI